MGIAITEDHLQLAAVVRAFLQGHDALGAARAALDAPADELPSFWKEAAGLGWLGLHLPEAAGGSGFGLDELAIVVAEFGRQAAPGPFLSTVIASAVVAAHGSADQRAAALPGLADGSGVAGVGLGGSLVLRDGLLAGDGGQVVSAEVADVLLLAVGNDMVLVDRHLPGVSVGPTTGSLDRGRRVASVTLAGCRVSGDNVLAGARSHALQICRALAAAEAAGGASACVDMAAEYAKIRVAFDRPIGQFQAIKHHCANMLAQAELATAAAWDAARAASVPDEAELPTAVAAAVAFPAFLLCANKNMQVHGGIGFTYAHDCHLYFRRAMSLMALFGPVEAAREQVLASALAGARPTAHLDPPEGSDELRAEVRAFAERYHALPEDERRGALLESGYLLPHWPKPWGRAATPAQQLVIDQELAGVSRVELGIGGWVALTLTAVGTAEQQERWVRPALDGTLALCQLFSEPDAGSDLAALKTKAVRADDGWIVNGQKVWTSGAHTADWGYALVRTNPDAPKKHAGLTVMMIDMRAPGVEVRPLRQITGDAHFNEVFLTDVYVPDSDVIGDVNQGWSVARATMGNERLVIGSKITHVDPEEMLKLAAASAPLGSAIRQDVAALLAEHHALTMLDLRASMRAVLGSEPGPEGNITKLLGNELDQRFAEVGMRMLGPSAAAALDGEHEFWGYQFLFTRAYTVGGGTSEMSRNTIGERILGLPRDPGR